MRGLLLRNLILATLVFGINDVSAPMASAETTYPSVKIIAKGKDSDKDSARTKAATQFAENCQKTCDNNGCSMVTSDGKGHNPSRVNSFCHRKGGTTTLAGNCICQCHGGETSLEVPTDLDEKNCDPKSLSVSGVDLSTIGEL